MNPAPKMIRATRDVDYVTAGETYSVEQEGKRTYFRNIRTGGGTSIANWQFDDAMRSGAFVAALGA